MIPAAQKKLREALFFLSRLKDQARTRVDRRNPEHAEYYFSAFLSASRSVTFALQAECKGLYDQWFPAWREGLSEAERLLLRRFTEERNQSEKRVGSTLRSVETLTPAAQALPPLLTVGRHAIVHANLDVHYGTAGLMVKFAMDGSEVSAEAAAGEYAALLERLLADFARDTGGAA